MENNPNNNEPSANIEEYQNTDSVNQGKEKYQMAIDVWFHEGMHYGPEVDVGPEMEQEAPPTLNGKPME